MPKNNNLLKIEHINIMRKQESQINLIYLMDLNFYQRTKNNIKNRYLKVLNYKNKKDGEFLLLTIINLNLYTCTLNLMKTFIKFRIMSNR